MYLRQGSAAEALLAGRTFLSETVQTPAELPMAAYLVSLPIPPVEGGVFPVRLGVSRPSRRIAIWNA
jgi:hypothetical protein